MEPSFIPNSVTSLELHTDTLHIAREYLSNNINKLRIKTGMLQYLNSFPQNLCSLSLEYAYSKCNNFAKLLPQKLTFLKLGNCSLHSKDDCNWTSYSESTGNCHIREEPNICECKSSYTSNINFKDGYLPNLKTLILVGTTYSGIEYLGFRSLDYLAVSCNFNTSEQDISFLDFVRELRLGMNFMGKISTSLPKKVKKLVLFCESKDDYIPEHVEELYLLGKYNIEKDTLNNNLKKLVVNNNYSKNINLEYIPKGIIYKPAVESCDYLY